MWRIAAELAGGWLIWALGGQFLVSAVHHIPFSVEQVVIDAIVWALWVGGRRMVPKFCRAIFLASGR